MKEIKESQKGLIFNIQKFSIHDGPGIRTSVFFKGCPLSCKWCSNPESQNPKMEIFIKDNKKRKKISIDNQKDYNFDKDKNIIIDDKFEKNSNISKNTMASCQYSQEGRFMEIDEIVEICLKDRDFYQESGGGVTLSGGEALMQIDFVRGLLKRLKAENIHTAIETTLFTSKKHLSSIIDYLDLVIFDIKHWDREVHKEFTGVYNDIILENIVFLLENKKEILPRIPVIPNFNYSKKDLDEFIKLFKNLGLEKVELLPFHQMGEAKYDRLEKEYSYRDVEILRDEDLSFYVEEFRKNGIEAFV